ncbi:hypothetical protein DSCA_45200 [Desulfosarcina alkanivorans]|jgi:hypothetical protein|uniref:Uncharacterized protein n=1 Tax=Desulfosarcina alkanivorans TaxID=571177 RepID=A0A5K7YQE9_9BACT|nr:hypothetical protein [Desulfosarcina alkanivorans]BBO70590.1 hypothetical protein DSCA_45200 [Desulfosarcina alkanivorans]
MEINTSDPMGKGIQGPGRTQKISRVNRERDEAPDRQASQAEKNPDYRVSLSGPAESTVSGPAGTRAAGGVGRAAALSEDEAARIARQASEQLAQTHTAITNQAIQKAVDLFT